MCTAKMNKENTKSSQCNSKSISCLGYQPIESQSKNYCKSVSLQVGEAISKTTLIEEWFCLWPHTISLTPSFLYDCWYEDEVMSAAHRSGSGSAAPPGWCGQTVCSWAGGAA